MQVEGFEILREQSRGPWHILYSAVEQGTGRPVVLKMPTADPPPPGDVEALENEYEILKDVAVAGVPRVLGLVRDHARRYLVLEDVAAIPLSAAPLWRHPELTAVIALAGRLADMLAELHGLGIVHKNLNTSSIQVHPETGRVYLTDFSMASRTNDTMAPGTSLSSRAMLSYMSPEQTGRMNRGTDYRTDYYSLGIVLYELLTGHVPFLSADPLEVMHWQIARAPVPPSQVDRRIPESLSRVVLKLLSKTVDDRYQSALGLKADLDAIVAAVVTGQQLPDFQPGRRDVWDRFMLPPKLYGRSAEVDAFRAVFDATCDGASALMLIAGYSGIGKTALIYQLYRPLVRRRGYFTAGKFDPVVRNTPFGALIQALSGAVQQILTEPDDRLAVWKERLSAAVGAGAGVLAEVIPEIELLLGKQAAPPQLGPAETLNRFQLVFQNFLGALAQRDHPLVIFLDDLQWADAATLSMLQPLLTSAEVRHLLLVGTYRDNEVDAAHPLTRTVSALEIAGVETSRLTVGPLALNDLVELLRDAFHPELADVEDVARTVLEKTGGNPFFAIQFLKTLRQEKLLTFDHRTGQWRFRREAVASASITDNVIDLMTRGILRLSPGAQNVLTRAACIGGEFDLQTLASIAEQSADETRLALQQATDEGFVLRLAEAAGEMYAFLHDRVQQAAYALMPEREKSLVHLRVGRFLLEHWNRDTAPEGIFDIVGHLNVGVESLEGFDSRLDLARLNLEAGRRAKASTAYDSAATHLDRGISMLPDDAWDRHYDLTFALSFEAAECHYLAGRFDVAEAYFERLLERAGSPLAKARVHASRIVLYENLSHYQRAVSSGREGLALFGILLPDDADEGQAALDAAIEGIERLLGERSVSSLVDQPEMTDENVRMVMRILTSLWSSAYITGNQVIARLISATMVRLSLAHGNAEDSAYGYVTHAITIGPMRGDYPAAYEWGALALAVNDRFGDTRLRAKVHQQFHAHVKLWRRPFDSCIQHAREARRSGLEVGDLNYAGYAAVTETWPAFLICRDLGQFVREYEPAAALLDRLRLADFLTALTIMLNWGRALQGRTANPQSLSNSYFDEEAFLAKFEHEPFFRTFFDTAKLHLSVLLENTGAALEWRRRARQGTLAGTIWPVLVDFWGGLALTRGFHTLSTEEQGESWGQLLSSERSLGILADNCPENFRCFWLLLSAEIKRLTGGREEAARLCRAAIAYAAQTGNVQMEALGNELCAAVCPDDGAKGFLIAAVQCYESWGASIKVNELREKHGNLASARVSSGSAAAREQTASVPHVSLDMSTVLKAAHAIGVEMQREDLLRKLMTIALESAGAQRSFFVRDRDGQLQVEAEGSVEGDSILRSAPLDEHSPLAAGVIRYVRTTGQSVVIADAATDERFAQDHYIVKARPRSILCVPAVHQGKLEGIFYLENNLAPDTFTAERIGVLDVIASQAAISLENARLYHEMKQEAARRRRADDALREMTEGTAAATGTDFFRSLVRHLASAIGVRYAFVTECRDEARGRARALAFWRGDGFGDNFEYDVTETPCHKVLAGNVCFYSDDIQRLFPNDRDLVDLNARSYVGAPMVDASERIIGHVAILDDKPMSEDPWASSILRIFAARAGAELERLRAEEGLRTALNEVEGLKNRLQAENVYLQEELRREHNFEEMVGSSPVLIEVLRRVERVAPTDATVLIYGETGTGKELIARAIHSRSRRRSRPLVKVNCGAISAGLVESELFGHVKGAFTGAIDKRVGRFELADGGTLFLDEVSELPLETQVKLLRVLQEQEFEPVGSSRSIRVSVRIIAATNRDLEEAVRVGRFRSDLFFRLNVLPLRIPPLRERPADIPQLATFFLSRFAKQFGKSVEGMTRDTVDLLIRYPWPGNVRELQNVIERAVVLSTTSVLKLDRDLLPLGGGGSESESPALPVTSLTAEVDPPLTLVEIERQHILAVLQQTGGVIEGSRGAARLLNLHPNTLRSRMKKLGVSRDPTS